MKEGVRLRVIGDRARFGQEAMREIERAEAATAGGTRLNLTIALSYGARAEILAAARAVAEAAAAGTLDPARLDEPHAERLLGDELVARAHIERLEEQIHLRGAERGAFAAQRAAQVAAALAE